MIIKSKNIYTEDGKVNGFLEVEGKKIKRITYKENIDEPFIDFSDYIIIPGIFDTHNHGTMGYDLGTSDNAKDNIRGYLRCLPAQGVTSVLPTADINIFKDIYEVFKENPFGTRIIGIHSEGPYLNRVGEKAIDYGHPEIDLNEIKKMIDDSKGLLKLVGIAPELKDADIAIEYLLSQGITIAFTHSNCNYDEAMNWFDKGIKITTHTANVMSGIHHRNMGGLGACLLNENVNNEIICDLLHVSKPMLEIMFKCKPFEKFIMISDSMALSGAAQGKYIYKGFNDREIIINITEEGYCLTEEGRLFGSTKPVIFGMKNLVQKLNIPLDKVILMSGLNPARLYGIGDKKGSLRVNKDADLVIIDNDFNVIQTYIEGEKVFDKEENKDLFNYGFLNKIQ